MTENFKTIFIVSNWESGTTLFQFLLARDPKIYNFFPDEESNYDGTAFWKRHGAHIFHRRFGNYFPPNAYEQRLDKSTIIKELNERFDENFEYGLFKRPQFILNTNLIRYLFDDPKIIAIKRDPIPTAYSYYRSNCTNNPSGKGINIGLKPPGWRSFEDKPLMEYIAWCYQYSMALIDKYDIPYIWYKNMCDATDATISTLENILGMELDIDYENIPNLNYVWKTGCQKMSRNLDTEKGKLDIKKTEKREVPPFTDNQINELNKYLNKYKDIDISI